MISSGAQVVVQIITVCASFSLRSSSASSFSTCGAIDGDDDRPASRGQISSRDGQLAADGFQRLASSSVDVESDHGIPASISRADSAVPIRPSPIIPTDALGVMGASAYPRLLRLDAGSLGIRRPTDDFAANEARRIPSAASSKRSRRLWRVFPWSPASTGIFRSPHRACRRSVGRVGGREQSIPDRRLKARHRLGERGQIGRQLVSLRRGHADAAQRAALHLRDGQRQIGKGQVDRAGHHVGDRLCSSSSRSRRVPAATTAVEIYESMRDVDDIAPLFLKRPTRGRSRPPASGAGPRTSSSTSTTTSGTARCPSRAGSASCSTCAPPAQHPAGPRAAAVGGARHRGPARRPGGALHEGPPRPGRRHLGDAAAAEHAEHRPRRARHAAAVGCPDPAEAEQARDGGRARPEPTSPLEALRSALGHHRRRGRPAGRPDQDAQARA